MEQVYNKLVMSYAVRKIFVPNLPVEGIANVDKGYLNLFLRKGNAFILSLLEMHASVDCMRR